MLRPSRCHFRPYVALVFTLAVVVAACRLQAFARPSSTPNNALAPRPTASRSTISRPEMVLQLGHRDNVVALAYAPNGRLFATAAREMDNGYAEVKIWDGHSGQLIRDLGGPFRHVTSLAFSPNSQTLAVGSEADGAALSLWRVATGFQLRRLSTKSVKNVKNPPGQAKGVTVTVASVVYTPNGKALVTGGGFSKQSGQVCLWDTTSGRLRSVLAPPDPGAGKAASPSAPPTALAAEVAPTAEAAPALSLSRDGQILAVPTPSSVYIWNLATKKLLHTLPVQGFDVFAVVVSPDGRRVVTGTSSGALKIWSTQTGRIQQDLRIKGGSAQSLAISPDGTVLVAGLYGGGGQGLVRWWNLHNGKELYRELYTKPVAATDIAALAFAPDGKSLAVASTSATVVNIVGYLHVGVWDIYRAQWRQSPLEPVDEVLCLAFSSDGH